MNYERLGNLLREARSNAKLTQPDVASKLGVTFQNVSSWERGKSKIDIDTLMRLCELYHISFVHILESANGTSYTTYAVPIFTPHEQSVISAYKAQPKAVQDAVDRMLDVPEETMHKQDDAEIAMSIADLSDKEAQNITKSNHKA